LVGQNYNEKDMKAARETVLRRIAQDNYPYPLDRDVAELESELEAIRDEFVWAPGRIVWDDPATISEGITEGVMIQSLFRKADSLHTELLIESAYFVTQDKSVKAVRKLTDRGVRVRVLTNSLASNDVVAAHAGHAKRRTELLESGLELYELRSDAGVVKQRSAETEAKAALHTKAVVFDGESIFIGSFNLDPRSAKINTEAGLYVESPALAKQLTAFMDEGVKPQNSYRVVLDEEGDLEWITEIDGREVRYHKEPESTILQRLTSYLIQMLPIEHQL